MSQRHIFHILYCKAIVYPGIRDTDLTGEACQHDPKVIVIPYPSYMKIHIVHASVDGACAGAATSSIGTQCRDAKQQITKRRRCLLEPKQLSASRVSARTRHGSQLYIFTRLAAWDTRRSPASLPGPATCDQLLAPTREGRASL